MAVLRPGALRIFLHDLQFSACTLPRPALRHLPSSPWHQDLGHDGAGALPRAIVPLPWATQVSDQPAAISRPAGGRDWWERTAIFRAYAQVLEPGDPAIQIYEAVLRTWMPRSPSA